MNSKRNWIGPRSAVPYDDPISPYSRKRLKVFKRRERRKLVNIFLVGCCVVLVVALASKLAIALLGPH